MKGPPLYSAHMAFEHARMLMLDKEDKRTAAAG